MIILFFFSNPLGISLSVISSVMTVAGILLIILVCAGVFVQDQPVSHHSVVYPAPPVSTVVYICPRK